MGVFLNSLHREILKKLSEKRLVSFKEPFKELVSLECLSGKEFAYIKNKYISENNQYIDFTLMTLCDYGIMSNSTFSYWGVFNAR